MLKNKKTNNNLYASLYPGFEFYIEQFYILETSESLDLQNPWSEFIGHIYYACYM